MAILWLTEPACQESSRTGGKAANLARLAAGYPVPAGFCLEAEEGDTLSPEVRAGLGTAYAELGRRCGVERPPVAVRSSAADEDGRQASFAGLHESYLNVVGPAAVAAAVARCRASARSPRALAYRRAQGLSPEARVAVLVQQLVPADAAAVVFSCDPATGERACVVINAAWGLGESLVGGAVTPDLYRVEKDSGAILFQQVGDKAVMTVLGADGTRQVAVPRAMRVVPALDDAQVVELAGLARELERWAGWPVDLECAYAGGRLYLLQCRPVTAGA
jgi:pyruvate,water dikinase